MATVNLAEYPQYKEDSLKLSAGLATLIVRMDLVMDSEASDEDKISDMTKLVETFKPFS